MEQAPKVQVAFIIPAYNIAEYIVECVDSIMRQTGISKQIIIVNDGSTDETGVVCDNIAIKYPEVKVVNKQNEGVSVARNIGMEHANAEYICFVDGDDYYLQDFAKDFYCICKNNNLDILRGQYKRIGLIDDKVDYPGQVLTSGKSISGHEFLHRSLVNRSSEVVPWLGFIKSDFIKHNNLTFPQGITYTEDQLFYLQMLLVKECKCMDVGTSFYGYRVRPGSATTNIFSQKKVDDIIYITKKELVLINDYPANRKDIFRFSSTTLGQIFKYYKLGNEDQRKYIITKIEKLPMAQLVANAYDAKIALKFFLIRYAPLILNLIY